MVEGDTVIVGVVAPVDHRMLVKLLPVTVIVEELPGWHMLAPPVMTPVGAGLTVTVTGEDVAGHPLMSVTVTLKVPEAVTLIDGVVAPLDHRYDPPGFALSVTLPPWQNVVGPDAVIVAVGALIGTTALVVVDDPQSFVAVTLRLAEPDAPAV